MKSLSIAGVVAVAAAAAAAPAAAGVVCDEPACAGGTGLGAAGATGAEPIDVIDSGLSNGETDTVAATVDEADEAGSAEAADAIGADGDGSGWGGVTIVVGAGAGDATGTPGGGDATANGSSISSSGKSGSCSSNGETGTSAKVSVFLTAVVEGDALVDGDGAWDVGGWGANCPCNDVMVSLTEVLPAGNTTADAFDTPDAASDEVGAVGDEFAGAAARVGTVVGANADVLAGVPARVGTVVDVLNDDDAVGVVIGVDAFNVGPAGVGSAVDLLPEVRGTGRTDEDVLAAVATDADAPAGARDTIGAAGDGLAGVLAKVGTVVDVLNVGPAAVGADIGVDAFNVGPAGVGNAVDLLPEVRGTGRTDEDVLAAVATDADAPAPPVGDFAVDELTPGVTPTGLEIFLAPGLEESEADALRGAAPVAPRILEEPVAPLETPTGREAPAGVVAGAIPGL